MAPAPGPALANMGAGSVAARPESGQSREAIAFAELTVDLDLLYLASIKKAIRSWAQITAGGDQKSPPHSEPPRDAPTTADRPGSCATP